MGSEYISANCLPLRIQPDRFDVEMYSDPITQWFRIQPDRFDLEMYSDPITQCGESVVGSQRIQIPILCGLSL